MVAVSVLVPVADDLEQVKELVRSLDRQTLPSADFEVVVRAGLEQLDTLAAHRPNLKVVSTVDPSRDLLAAVDGDFVLTVGQDETLFPGSLARLRDFAEQHGVDAVMARVVRPRVPAPVELWADTDRLENGATVPGQLFVRREAAELTDGELRPTATSRVAVLAAHAVTLRHEPVGHDAPASGSVAPDVTIDSVAWSDGSLRLVLRTAGGDSAPVRAVLQLTHGETRETFLVPTEISTAEAGPEVQVEAAIAPTRTPAEGQQLAPGPWHVDLVLASEAGTGMTVPVPWSPCPPALIGGTAVVPAPATTTDGPLLFTLDVGPLDHALIRVLDTTEGTVTESVIGSELVLNLPQLHVSDSEGLDGFIALGKMRLPARLRIRDGRAQLVALVSGLAGQSPLSAQFGPGPLRATGLSLQVTGGGAMSVIKTPPPAPKPPTKPPSAPKPPAKAKKRRKRKMEPPRTGLAADLRRAVPAPLEPAVKRLASMPVARRLYRRVTH